MSVASRRPPGGGSDRSVVGPARRWSHRASSVPGGDGLRGRCSAGQQRGPAPGREGRGNLLDTSVYVDVGSEITSALVGRSCGIRARVHVAAGAATADQCVLGEEVQVSAGVHVYPAKHVRGGGYYQRERHEGPRAYCSGPRRESGDRAVPHHPRDRRPDRGCLRSPAAQATVTVGVGPLAGSAGDEPLPGRFADGGRTRVRDLRIAAGRARATCPAAQGGVYLRTTLGVPESLDLLLLDRSGSDLSVPERQRLGADPRAPGSSALSRATSATSTPRTDHWMSTRCNCATRGGRG